MPADDANLYGIKRKRNLNNGTEISSSTTLSFTSQLSSLINTSSASSSSKVSSGRPRPKKSDIFATHNRNASKRAKRDLDPDLSNTFAQKHSTSGGPALDPDDWSRSQRKLEDKARLYSAMQRGDILDEEDRYAVDFDSKWAAAGGSPSAPSSPSSTSTSSPSSHQIEYTDEFGRTRLGTELDALRSAQALSLSRDDGLGARPSAPSTLIFGDAIQFSAFDPDARAREAMAALAAKRDRSLTPPPESHFDDRREVRTKGTGFFRFSGDEDERRRQMEGLEGERRRTERERGEEEGKGKGEAGKERERMVEERRRRLEEKRAKREAERFLSEMGREIGGSGKWKGEGEEGG